MPHLRCLCGSSWRRSSRRPNTGDRREPACTRKLSVARSAASATLSNISRPAAIFRGSPEVVRITARWNETSRTPRFRSNDHRTCFDGDRGATLRARAPELAGWGERPSGVGEGRARKRDLDVGISSGLLQTDTVTLASAKTNASSSSRAGPSAMEWQRTESERAARRQARAQSKPVRPRVVRKLHASRIDPSDG